jgi:exonuclease III
MKYGQDMLIATLNMRGSKTMGKREEIEGWMKGQNTCILTLQETHVGVNSKETRAQYTWYFSGEQKCREGYTAGVGFVIRNDYLQYVEDIQPINDRICILRLRHAAPITLIGVYIPQAFRPDEEKEAVYKELTKYTKKYRHDGPTYVLGDFNARVQARTNEAEEEVIGPHTFERGTADPWNRSDEVICNRQNFIGYCTENKMKAMNAYFHKNN